MTRPRQPEISAAPDFATDRPAAPGAQKIMRVYQK